jgi:hypothetical protein
MTESIDSLVSRPVLGRLTAMCEKFNSMFFGSPSEESQALRNPISVPIERVLLTSHQDLSAVSLLGQDSRPDLHADAIVSPVGDLVTVVASRETVLVSKGTVTSSFLAPSEVIGGVVLLSPDLVLVFSHQTVYLYSTSGDLLADYAKHVVKGVAITANQAVVSTADDAVYILTVSEGSPSKLSHQLMIAPSQSSLGKIFSLALCEDNFLLALVGSVAVLILDLSFVDKPKLVFKKVISVVENDSGLWVGDSLVLPKTGLVLRRTAQGSGFEAIPHFPDEVRLGYDCMYPISESVVALKRGDRLTLAQFTKDWSDVSVLSNPDCMHVLPSGESQVVSVRGGEASCVVVSLRAGKQNCVCVDVHKAEVVRWIEHVFSYAHSEKFDNAIELLIALKKGTLPLLLDSMAALSEETLVVGMVSKISKSSPNKLDWKSVVRLAAHYEFMEQVADLFAGRREFFLTVLELVVGKQVPTSALNQQVVMRTIDTCIDDSRIDDFLAMAIVCGGPKGEILIDTNQAVRIATAKDLSLSVVLIHTYLLRDLLFPVKYWASSSSPNELVCYYLYCLTKGRKFPCMDAPEPDSYSALRSVVQEERSVFEKIFLRDPETVIECIGWDFLEEVKIIASTHPDIRNEIAVYETKCAVAHGEPIDVKACIEALIKKSELPLILAVLEKDNGAQVSQKDLMSIFKQLVSDSVPEDSAQIVKFALRFLSNIDTSVDICLEKRRLDVAVKLLAKNNSFEKAVKLILDEGAFSYQRKVDLAVWITTRSKGSDAAIASLWTNLLSQADAESAIRERGDVRRALACSVDMFQLAENIPSIKIKAWLMQIARTNHGLLSQAAAVAALDVGAQFTVLASTNATRSKGVPVTACICHSCLDPIAAEKSSKRNELMLFSCGHIVHTACGDRSGCPVCV